MKLGCSPPCSLESLLRLLDDETPEVRDAVELALLDYEGDVSAFLAGSGEVLSFAQRRELSALLRPARERRARDEWVVPLHRLRDWESGREDLEGLLRVLSDFLHDGVEARPSLSDQLDGWVARARARGWSWLEVVEKVWSTEDFFSVEGQEADPGDYDLARALQTRELTNLNRALLYVVLSSRFGQAGVLGLGEGGYVPLDGLSEEDLTCLYVAQNLRECRQPLELLVALLEELERLYTVQRDTEAAFLMLEMREAVADIDDLEIL